jgi:hypothetical protein
MGSLATTSFCTESHLGHSNRRCSKPMGPGLMLVSIMRDVQCGQRRRSMGVSCELGENCDFDMTVPQIKAGAQNSQSPVDAEEGR